MSAHSELGAQDMFRTTSAAAPAGGPAAAAAASHGSGASGEARGARAIVAEEIGTGRGWGKGPVMPDSRKYAYDRLRALTLPAVKFSSSKVDRLDPDEAGAILHRIHESLGIAQESEARLYAFDSALWWQHFVNGASMLQPGRGVLWVDGMTFDISECLRTIGESQLRRFFRAYADDIAEVARGVIQTYNPYDAVATDKYGQLMQVAAERGMHKFPEYAFDAADACLTISMDVRRAIMASKNVVLPRVNMTDQVPVAARALPAEQAG
jgi:hypothetical protein